MPLIQSPNPKPRRTKITLRLDEPLARTVHRYAEFIRATNEYVIAQALNYFFDRDQEFNEWLTAHPNSTGRSRSRTTSPNSTADKEPEETTHGTAERGSK
ncbi:MAG TPA: hypothetical protein VJO35_18835 [Terriglobales bacterium]|nr:hypothetical protein [Terriglobales bacterium]